MTDAQQLQRVHELDVRKAQQDIRATCDQASSNWIPRNAIADALLLEYVNHASGPQVIDQLEQLISILKGEQSRKMMQ